MGRREACSGQRERHVGRRRGRASTVSGQQRRGLPEPRSGRRTVLLAGLPAPPAQGPVALHPDHRADGGRSPWLLLSPPGSPLLPPPLPAVSTGHRAPSHLPGLPRPILSSLPRPSPVPATPASSRALERCSRAPCTRPWCLAPSAQEALPRHLHASSPAPSPVSVGPRAPPTSLSAPGALAPDLPHCPACCRPPRSHLCLLCCPCGARETAARNTCSLSVCRMNEETLGSPGSPDPILKGQVRSWAPWGRTGAGHHDPGVLSLGLQRLPQGSGP